MLPLQLKYGSLLGLGSTLQVLTMSPYSRYKMNSVIDHQLILTVESNEYIGNSHWSDVMSIQSSTTLCCPQTLITLLIFANKIMANIECFSAIVSFIETLWKMKRNNQFSIFVRQINCMKYIRKFVCIFCYSLCIYRCSSKLKVLNSYIEIKIENLNFTVTK